MPQATDNLRNTMNKWFGDPVSDAGPLAFLEARGWTFPKGMITPPVSAHTPSMYEFLCIEFMCDEWDYAYEGTYYFRTAKELR